MKIPKSLKEDMKAENLIRREDLWTFLQKHKEKTKGEFGGWLIGQETRRTDKLIMAIDLWNLLCKEKLKPSLFQCNICGEIFDTKTGKGKMHMAGHGKNLPYAIEEGLAERIT